MGSVAAALRERGFTVTGSDENIYPPMSTSFGPKGSRCAKAYRAENIPDDAETVVVIGNAIKRGNPEVEAVLNRKLYYLSLPEMLKEFFLRGRHNLVVTGTHGKTTTTALLTWILTRRRTGSRLHDRRHPEQPRAGRALQRVQTFRDRGRRIRHRVLRQALQVRPLPAGVARDQQHRVRSRRHLSTISTRSN